nr:PREDICTED: uncharacterized protein LOC100884026 isoform X4 [Megachile rotundata]
MKWPLVLTCFLLPHSCILGASHAGCEFPAQWNGHWFQSGNQGLVTVNGSMMTSKGRCIETKDDKFLTHDKAEKCYRCIVMHMKHPNVLQYKETYCTDESPKPSLLSMCSKLTSDTILISLFRTGAAPMACPFKGPLEFTYSHGEGECKFPLSIAETCTQESRLLLRYQACANVYSSESVDVELECLATWKEGSTYNLVARLHGARKTNDEDSYRCFIYEQTSNNSWNLAQSADASCAGLISIKEAARTFKLKQKNSPNRCTYPSWVVANKSWVALDPIASRLQASPYNMTILDRKETRLVCHSVVPISDRPFNPDKENQVQYVAKATLDCTNGYVCLMFHRRDDHVIEMQLSEWSQQPDNVCNSSTFNSHSTPYTTFIEYWCHGTWIENDTAYLVASTDVGRYCLVYSASAAATGSRELSVTGHLASCPRPSHRHLVSWQVNLTSYAQCGDISTATSWTFRISASVYVLLVLGIIFSRYIAR